MPVDTESRAALYRIVGYRIAGTRAVRIDILERLADLIRPLIAWRPTPESPTPPDGAIDGYGFTVTVAMTSLLGCSGEDFASVLSALGYRVDRRPAPPKPAARGTVRTGGRGSRGRDSDRRRHRRRHRWPKRRLRYPNLPQRKR